MTLISFLQAHVTNLSLRWLHTPHTEARRHENSSGVCVIESCLQ